MFISFSLLFFSPPTRRLSHNKGKNIFTISQLNRKQKEEEIKETKTIIIKITVNHVACCCAAAAAYRIIIQTYSLS